MNKIFSKINNNIYFVYIITIFILTNILNISQQMRVCALIYVLLSLSATLMSELYGKRKAIQIIILSALVSAPLLFNMNYYISGNKIDYILIGSFVSLIVSIYCGISIFSKLASVSNFHTRNITSLLISSVLDSTIMSIFFLLSNLSLTKISSILINDIIYKSSYSLGISASLLIISYLLQQLKRPKNI